jgi:hypothetical protein
MKEGERFAYCLRKIDEGDWHCLVPHPLVSDPVNGHVDVVRLRAHMRLHCRVAPALSLPVIPVPGG